MGNRSSYDLDRDDSNADLIVGRNNNHNDRAVLVSKKIDYSRTSVGYFGSIDNNNNNRSEPIREASSRRTNNNRKSTAISTYPHKKSMALNSFSRKENVDNAKANTCADFVDFDSPQRPCHILHSLQKTRAKVPTDRRRLPTRKFSEQLV